LKKKYFSCNIEGKCACISYTSKIHLFWKQFLLTKLKRVSFTLTAQNQEPFFMINRYPCILISGLGSSNSVSEFTPDPPFLQMLRSTFFFISLICVIFLQNHDPIGYQKNSVRPKRHINIPLFFVAEMKNDFFINKKLKIKNILQNLSKFYWW